MVGAIDTINDIIRHARYNLIPLAIVLMFFSALYDCTVSHCQLCASVRIFRNPLNTYPRQKILLLPSTQAHSPLLLPHPPPPNIPPMRPRSPQQRPRQQPIQHRRDRYPE